MNYNSGNKVNNNINGNVYNSYKPFSDDDVMTDERKKYLLQKEMMIRSRKSRKRLITLTLIIIFLIFGGSYLYQNYFRSVEIDSRIDKSSIHYVTDLYYSDGRYYEEYLDPMEKGIYIEFLKDLKELKTITTIDCREFGYSNSNICVGSISLIIDVILMEHPDLFWYRNSDYSYSGDSSITINHHYVSTNKVRLYFVERRLLRKIDELASSFDKKETDVEKVEAVYTWLGETTTYSTLMTRKSGTAWSALLSDDSVCAGFAAASQLLFQRMGIESVLVVGSSDGIGHAWNFIKLDDEYYWYDSTVAGSNDVDSSYFYRGLFFNDDTHYTPGVIDMRKYQFGSKYLRES